jgi:tetratricopeptide (TPR) repeat protein
LEQAPIAAGYRRLRLEVLLADGPSEAVANLCQALMETPANDTAAFVVDVAQILAQAEDFDRARAWVEAGRARHQGSGSLARLEATLAYRQARWEDAETLWNQLAQSDDQNTRKEARVFRARIAAATNRNEDATRLYSEVLEDDPGDERAARHVVRQTIGAGRLDEAQAALERFEAHVGRTPLVVRLRAMLATGRRDGAAAVAEYQKGIAEHPRDIDLKCRFADLYDDLGDHDAMDAVLRGAESLAPQDPRELSRQLTAGAARGLAPRHLLSLAERLLAVRPDDQGVLRQKANLLIRLGERHEAVNVLLTALDANSANVSLWTSACSNL